MIKIYVKKMSVFHSLFQWINDSFKGYLYLSSDTAGDCIPSGV